MYLIAALGLAFSKYQLRVGTPFLPKLAALPPFKSLCFGQKNIRNCFVVATYCIITSRLEQEPYAHVLFNYFGHWCILFGPP